MCKGRLLTEAAPVSLMKPVLTTCTATRTMGSRIGLLFPACQVNIQGRLTVNEYALASFRFAV